MASYTKKCIARPALSQAWSSWVTSGRGRCQEGWRRRAAAMRAARAGAGAGPVPCPAPDTARTGDTWSDYSQMTSITTEGKTYVGQYGSTDQSERIKPGDIYFHNGPLGHLDGWCGHRIQPRTRGHAELHEREHVLLQPARRPACGHECAGVAAVATAAVARAGTAGVGWMAPGAVTADWCVWAGAGGAGAAIAGGTPAERETGLQEVSLLVWPDRSHLRCSGIPEQEKHG